MEYGTGPVIKFIHFSDLCVHFFPTTMTKDFSWKWAKPTYGEKLYFLGKQNLFYSLKFDIFDILATKVSKISLWSFPFEIVFQFGHYKPLKKRNKVRDDF